MSYSFDSYGWLSTIEIPGRTTSIDPQFTENPVVGTPYPNWTGHEWILVPFSLPPIPDPKPAQRADIQDKLDKIDKQTSKPRTIREIQLGNATTIAWLAAQDAQAITLRAQLAALG